MQNTHAAAAPVFVNNMVQSIPCLSHYLVYNIGCLAPLNSYWSGNDRPQMSTSICCTFVCFMQDDNFLMIVFVCINLCLFRFLMKDCNLLQWASWPQRL